jgi:hypothetical protein
MYDSDPRWDEWRKPARFERDVENRRWDDWAPSPAAASPASGSKWGEEWPRDTHFDTAPARSSPAQDRYDAPMLDRRREWRDDRWRRDDPRSTSQYLSRRDAPRRTDMARIPEVSSVLPAPVLPKPAPPKPEPEPAVSRVNIKFSYKVNSGPTEKAEKEQEAPENAPENTPEWGA